MLEALGLSKIEVLSHIFYYYYVNHIASIKLFMNCNYVLIENF